MKAIIQASLCPPPAMWSARSGFQPTNAAAYERRRAANAADRPEVERILLEHGFRPALPAAANFLYAGLGTDSRPFFEELLREGVIVRPTHGFGCPEGFRVTVGTAAENAFFAEALQRARPA